MSSDLNPSVSKMHIGTRKLREITVYPLSLSDQLDIPDLIAEAFSQFASNESEATTEFESNVETVKNMVETLKDNLVSVLERITDKEDDVTINNLTNDQFVELATIIFDQNYGSSMGKFKTLVGKVKALTTGKTTATTQKNK